MPDMEKVFDPENIDMIFCPLCNGEGKLPEGHDGIKVCPQCKDCCYHNEKMILRIRPLFPNYLFGNFDLELHYYRVKWTRGVGLILGNGGGPIPVSERLFRPSGIGLEGKSR